MRYFTFLIFIVLIGIPSIGYSNPVPMPIEITELSTDEDWIEIYCSAEFINDSFNNYYYLQINGHWVDINVPISTEDDDAYSYIVLDQTNTSGFDLPDGYGSIKFSYTPDYRYGTWGPIPAPPKNESVASGVINPYPSPGEPNIVPKAAYGSSDIVINEILPYADDSQNSFVELYNRGETPINIGNWSLVAGTRYRIPSDTIIGPGEFWILDSTAYPDGFMNQRYSYEGVVYLQDDGGVMLEAVGWSEKEHIDHSLIRYPDGFATGYRSNNKDTNYDYRESIPTPGAPNYKKYSITSMQIEGDSVIVNPGEQYQLMCIGTDTNNYSYYMLPDWEIDENILTIDKTNLLTAIISGQCMINAVCDDVIKSKYVIVTLAGTLQQNTSLLSESSPYWVGDLHVPEGITLNIEPGTKIIINTSDYALGLTIDGSIYARGDAQHPITFTPLKSRGQINVLSGGNVLEYCTFKDFDTSLHVSNTKDNYINTISYCTFTNNNTSIRLEDGDVIVSNCFISNDPQNLWNFGISISENIDSVSIYNNTLYQLDNAFYITSSCPRITNNIIYNCNLNFGFSSYGILYPETSIEYNDVWPSYYSYYGGPFSYTLITTQNIYGTPCDQYFNISADPMFANPDAGDFRLLSGSPCIDAGDPTILDGDGTISDIGCWSGIPPMGIALTDNVRPDVLTLYPNVPNPFNPSTTIPFALPEPCRVRLEVYSITGQKVATLVDGHLSAGSHFAVFDGNGLPSGMYITRLVAGSARETGKMLLVK